MTLLTLFWRVFSPISGTPTTTDTAVNGLVLTDASGVTDTGSDTATNPLTLSDAARGAATVTDTTLVTATVSDQRG